MAYRPIINIWIFVILFSGCQASRQHSTPLSIADPLDMTLFIPFGVVETDAATPSSQADAVRQQLMYLVGIYRAEGALVDLSRLNIGIKESGRKRMGRPTVTYEAHVPVFWQPGSKPRHKDVVLLPVRGDSRGRKLFHSAFGELCTAEAALWSRFWFSYQPERPGCPLVSDEYDRLLVLEVEIVMTASPQRSL